MHRFFTTFETPLDQPMTLVGEQARQIARVLRLRRGERIAVFDGSGRERLLVLDQIGPERVVARVEREHRPAVEPCLQLTLVQAVLKGDAMDLVVQKATEAGVAAIHPVITERSVPRRVDAAKLGRWRRIAQEAAEQSGRTVVPSVGAAVMLDEALPALPAAMLALWEEERAIGIAGALAALPRPFSQLALLIGPEGGLAEREIAQARSAGGQVASLGPRILRADTAGLIAMAAIMFAAGELGGPPTTGAA